MKNPTIFTPFDFSAPVKAGRRRFWKQVLPVTKINYKGQEVNFDPAFHHDLSESFREGAFDQVPVVFADQDNRHTMDPRQFGGDVLDMQYRGPAKDQGTWALIEADKDAAKAIRRNPKLGVSARIRQMVEKADGRMFPRAIEHICLTMNPRVTGMGPWQAVDLSDEDADIEVVDLTAINYEEGNTMAKGTRRRSTSRGTLDLSSLTDEQFDNLLDLAEAALADPEAEEDENLDEEQVQETEPQSKIRKKKSKTKITVEDESEDNGDEGDEEEQEPEETDLSDDVFHDGERSQFAQMRIDLAEERWNRDRDSYIQAGVPPFLLDLAEPVLNLPDAVTIDLSDDETLDASSVVRQMLDGVRGVLDFSDEMGHQIDLSSADESVNSENDAFESEWEKQYG